MYNDVFLSYRHESGNYLTQFINTKLTEKEVRCFFDNNSIHNDDFLKKMREGIEGAPNFLGVLTPGYFVRREGEEDYVRKELEWAIELKKNIIFIADEKFDFNEIDWDKEPEEFRVLKYKKSETYHSDSDDRMLATFFEKIVGFLEDEKGNTLSLKRKNQANSYYAETGGLSEEDLKWIVTDHDVNARLDWDVLGTLVRERIFKDRDTLHLFSYKTYEVDTYRDKYDITKFSGCQNLDKRLEVYGITYPYKGFIDRANEVFGEGHYVDDVVAEGTSYSDKLGEVLKKNGLKGFDIIDLTLVIKDTDNPGKTVREVVKYLNPDGGIIYIRELDDDYLDAFPDKEGYVKKLKGLLDLDRGAGNRHCGKRVLSFLKRAGADKVHMSDHVVTTANHKAKFNRTLCDTYFSYLIPEFAYLTSKPADEMDDRDRRYADKYKEAYEWLLEYYDDVLDLFGSDEFYFRAGYVAGYGVFLPEDEE